MEPPGISDSGEDQVSYDENAIFKVSHERHCRRERRPVRTADTPATLIAQSALIGGNDQPMRSEFSNDSQQQLLDDRAMSGDQGDECGKLMDHAVIECLGCSI